MHLLPQKGALSLPCTGSLFPWVGFGASFWPLALGPRFGRLSGPGLAKALPRLFLTGFGRPVFGPDVAPFWVRVFWAVCARRAAAFPGFEALALGPRFGRWSGPVASARGLAKA